MKRVVLYTRVSTDEQAHSGFSLDYQYSRLKLYCEQNNFQILNHFKEDHSAKNFDRPEWKKLHSFVKSKKRELDAVLVVKWDRFSRNQEQALSVIREYTNWGVEIDAIEQPLDLKVPENKAILAFYLVMPEIDNDRRSIEIKKGNHQALLSGCFINKAPYGYKNLKIVEAGGSRQTLEVIPERAQFIQEAFERVSTGIESAETVLKDLRGKGFEMSKSNFLRMLRKIVYTGKILVPPFKEQPEKIVEGRHEAIIDFYTFQKVQDVLNGKRWHGVSPNPKNELFPLRNFLVCDCCMENVTASSSTGRNGKHHYYHCKNGTRIKRSDVHQMFNELLGELVLSEEVKELYRSILLDAAKKESKSKKNRITEIEKEIVSVQGQIKNMDLKYSTGEVTSERYNRIVGSLENRLLGLKVELEESREASTPIFDHINNTIDLLTNLAKIYENSSYEMKRVLLGSIFVEKLIISRTECRTTEIYEVVGLLTRNIKGFEDKKKGTNLKNIDLSRSVLEAGLEPARPKRAQDFKSGVSTNSTTRA